MQNRKTTRNQILNVISGEVHFCTKCRLCEDTGLSVFGEGNPEADIMLVGEGPGQMEAETGRPFVGKAGKLLDNMISSIELKREDIYIANIVKHRPPNNRNPEPDEIKVCLPYLKMQIEVVSPAFLLVLGSVAMNTLLGPGLGIIKRCGEWDKYVISTNNSEQYIPAMPIFHPAALLRNPEWKKPTWYALQEFKKEYENFNIGK